MTNSELKMFNKEKKLQRHGIITTKIIDSI